MKQLLFVQGGGDAVHDDWDKKLVDSLSAALGPGYAIRYPRMPNEADPIYAAWKAALEHEFADLDDGAILAGHSIGAAILISVLAQGGASRRIAGLFLVSAPFIGNNGWKSGEMPSMAQIGRRLPEGLPVYLYHGSHDDIVPLAHLGLYADAIPRAVIRTLAGRNHQLDDDLSIVADDVRRLPD